MLWYIVDVLLEVVCWGMSKNDLVYFFFFVMFCGYNKIFGLPLKNTYKLMDAYRLV